MRDWSAVRTTGRPNFRGEMKAAAKRGTTASPRKTTNGDDNARAEWYPPDWAEISQKIRQRDGYRCRISRLFPNIQCDGYFPPPFHGNLHVHHIEPLPKGSNKPVNLICLCKDHHGFVHGREFGKKISHKAKAAARRW